MITLWWDQRQPVHVDEEEFCLIRMMLEECGRHEDIRKSIEVIKDLVGQGYKLRRARELVILARTQWKDEYGLATRGG